MLTQHEINRAVAQATGESVAEIEHLGFSLADPDDIAFDPEPGEGQYVDWDALDAERYALSPC
jgi:hypothetical protein